ncbi:MAG: NTP transferase domain-containing protein, partial [Actinomycetales bacterium]
MATTLRGRSTTSTSRITCTRPLSGAGGCRAIRSTIPRSSHCRPHGHPHGHGDGHRWQSGRVAIAGLVLAAGSGSRFGQPKAGVLIDGERLVDRAVRILSQAGADPVLVVLGA